jgi:glucosamine--fructose-6-phosphate aminotransferase (isomerizing)
MSDTGLSRYVEAVRAQGQNLRASGAAVAEQLRELDLTPWRNRRLGLIGMGASYNAALASRGSFWAAGLAAAPWLGTDLERPGAARNVDAVIGISQTGRSAEVISCLATLPNTHPKLGLTDDPQSRLATIADATVSLSLLEDSEVRTLGYTGTLQGLGILRDALAPEVERPDWNWLADEVDGRIAAADDLAERVVETIREFGDFDVVGSGASFGSAAQGALLLREVCRLPASAYETYNYLHGPLEAVGPGMALIAIGGARETRLAISMAAAGATVLLVTSEQVDEQPGMVVFRFPPTDEALRPVLEILPLQTLSGAIAKAKGLPVGQFRHHQDDTKLD